MNEQLEVEQVSEYHDPVPTKGPLADHTQPSSIVPTVPQNENTQPLSPKQFTKVILEEIFKYLIGLMAILAVVSLFAFPLSYSLMSHYSEYFGNFADVFNIIFIGPFVLIAFGLISAIRKDWLFMLYPFAVFFFFGPLMYSSPVSEALAISFPFKIQNLRSTNQYIAAILLAYATVYTLERSLSCLARIGRFRQRPISKAITVSQIIILTFLLLVCVVSPVLAQRVIKAKQISLMSVRIPRTSEFSTISEASNPKQSLTIYYLTPTSQYAGTYNMRDTVTYTNIEQGASKNVRQVCGEAVSSSGGNVVNKISYQKAGNGLEYGSYTVPLNGSQPPRKTLAYNEYHACFVIDGKKYDLVRSSRFGDAYLTKYPTGKIVAAFADAKSYVHCATTTKLCSRSDVERTRSLNKVQITEPNIDEGEANINPNAYTKVGSMVVKEWGIQIPLSDESKDLYYAPPSSPTFIYAGLASVNNNRCYAGVKNGSTGYGVAYITRTLKSTVDAQKGSSTKTSTPYKQVGDYVYSVYASGNARSCLGSEESYQSLEDALDWSTVNITPL